MDIPGSQISPGAFTKVLVLDSGRAVGSWRQSRLFAASGLNARLFVSRNDEVVVVQRSAVPNVVVKIETGPALASKSARSNNRWHRALSLPYIRRLGVAARQQASLDFVCGQRYRPLCEPVEEGERECS